MVAVLSVVIWCAYLIALYFVIFWLLVLLDKGLGEEDKDINSFPKVTVGIPAYNEEKTIGKTIESVLKLDYPDDKIEIIAVNDGSKDGTSNVVNNMIKNNPGRKIILIDQKNSGKGAALNKALSLAKGEFFTCLDADSFIREDALKKMLPEFEDKEVAAVLPLMKIKDPQSVLQKIQWCEYLINFFYKKLMAKLDCVHVAPGPFSVYRKKTIQELGGFSEHNLTEDLEISLRIQKHNYKIIQLLNTEVYTVAPKNLKAFYKQRNRWYKGTMLNVLNYRKMMFNKDYGDFGVFQLPRVFLSGFLAVSMIIIAFYHFGLKPASKWFYDMSFVNFDILYFFNKWMQNFSLLDLNMTNAFFGIVTFIISLTVIRYAHKFTQEKALRYGIISIPAYLLLYGIMASGIWLGVFVELLIGKKQRW